MRAAGFERVTNYNLTGGVGAMRAGLAVVMVRSVLRTSSIVLVATTICVVRVHLDCRMR
jgi:hypothetical protein